MVEDVGHWIALDAGGVTAEAVAGLETTSPPLAAIEAVVAVAGEEAAERAVAVSATFQMMNRLLDGTGTPMPPGLEGTASLLGFDPGDLYLHSTQAGS